MKYIKKNIVILKTKNINNSVNYFDLAIHKTTK